MTRRIVESAGAKGSLVVDPKTDEAATAERQCAWDEDLTTLAIDAASQVDHARAVHVLASVKLDARTIATALDLKVPIRSIADPMSASADHSGPTLLLGGDAGWAVAVMVDGPAGSVPAPVEPRLVSPPPRMVSALRALQESRRVPPAEAIPDSPMGAYVPMGTWVEDLPARLRLEAQRCTACSRVMYPPRGACPACGARAFEPVALPPEAVVYAATRIGRGGAPSEFALEQAQTGAYWVGVVEWPEHGVRVTARLSSYDADAPAIGERVRPIVRRLFDQEGQTRYGVKFCPAGH